MLSPKSAPTARLFNPEQPGKELAAVHARLTIEDVMIQGSSCKQILTGTFVCSTAGRLHQPHRLFGDERERLLRGEEAAYARLARLRNPARRAGRPLEPPMNATTARNQEAGPFFPDLSRRPPPGPRNASSISSASTATARPPTTCLNTATGAKPQAARAVRASTNWGRGLHLLAGRLRPAQTRQKETRVEP